MELPNREILEVAKLEEVGLLLVFWAGVDTVASTGEWVKLKVMGPT